MKRGEPKRGYDDDDLGDCDHEYDEDEDTGEYVCHCGHRERIPLDKIIRL